MAGKKGRTGEGAQAANDLKKVETEVEKLEARDAELDEMLMDESIYSDPAKLMEINSEKTEIAARLETLMEEWEKLAAEPEITSQLLRIP